MGRTWPGLGGHKGDTGGRDCPWPRGQRLEKTWDPGSFVRQRGAGVSCGEAGMER